MADLSDFKRGQIVGARTVTKPTELFGEASITALKVMTAFEKEGKTSPLKQNSGRKRKLPDKDRRIVWKGHKNTVLKIITEINNHLKNSVDSKTVRRGG